MKEIKFRVWDGEKMHYLQEIEYFDDSINFRFSHFEKTGIPLKMMLYTGLKDKNGKEIYEGDIIKVETLSVYERDGWDSKTGEYIGKIPHEQKINEIKIVEWGTDGFNLIHSNWVDWGFEVIGNIYENPELVKGDDMK